MKNRLRTAAAAVTLAIAAAGLTAAPHAHAAEKRSACAQADDPACNPGAGWTEVFITHTGTNGTYAANVGGGYLDQADEQSACFRVVGMYFWYRPIVVNATTVAQFVLDGDDGNFHALGYSGGAWKLQAGVSGWWLWPWNESGSNWSYANETGDRWMGSQDQDLTFLRSDTSPLTHWALVSAPFPQQNSCNTTAPPLHVLPVRATAKAS